MHRFRTVLVMGLAVWAASATGAFAGSSEPSSARSESNSSEQKTLQKNVADPSVPRPGAAGSTSQTTAPDSVSPPSTAGALFTPAAPISSPDLRERVSQLYEKGNRLLDARRYAEAERAFLDALKLAPDIPAIHHGLGLVYIQIQDYESAVLHLEDALRREPNQVKTIYTLSKAYAALGENQKAEEGYKRAIEINPSFQSAYTELAGIYYREKKWDEALAALERARTLNPRSAQTLTLIGVTGLHSNRLDIAFDAVTQLRAIGRQREARRLEYLIATSERDST